MVREAVEQSGEEGGSHMVAALLAIVGGTSLAALGQDHTVHLLSWQFEITEMA